MQLDSGGAYKVTLVSILLHFVYDLMLLSLFNFDTDETKHLTHVKIVVSNYKPIEN